MVRGQFSSGEIIFGGNCLGGNYLGGNHQGGNYLGAVIQGKLSGEQLSMGKFLSRKIVLEPDVSIQKCLSALKPS